MYLRQTCLVVFLIYKYYINDTIVSCFLFRYPKFERKKKRGNQKLKINMWLTSLPAYYITVVCGLTVLISWAPESLKELAWDNNPRCHGCARTVFLLLFHAWLGLWLGYCISVMGDRHICTDDIRLNPLIAVIKSRGPNRK